MPYQREGTPILPPMAVVRHEQFPEKQAYERRPPVRVLPTAAQRAAMTRPINTRKTSTRTPSPAERALIRNRLEAGESGVAIAAAMGFSKYVVSRIKQGHVSDRGVGRPRKSLAAIDGDDE